MNANVDDIKKRLKAVMDLCTAPTLSAATLGSARTLIAGISPDLDRRLGECERNFALLEHLKDGTVVVAAVESLPEETEEDKKRKRLLLLFLRSWDDFKSEVARVQNEFNQQQQQAPNTPSSGMWWRIFKGARGPLAIITLGAVALVVMAQTSVEVTIQNNGCGTLYAQTSVPVSIPGLKLPNQNIGNGGSATATIPPLPLTVDGTSGNALTLTSIGFLFTIQLGSSVKKVTFDDQSLLGTTTRISLAGKAHTLALTCK